ncbi:uroporphyrinogen-III synthase [Parendozoicomonas sp. Alg238-R29]|uniref:uroporphyrinogen-III synthase n=1 Tax=Parendozoicomonas sp. Alg238-R29 TaxID=2993446 RepID=UPI00248D3B1C|nr:uroporphyrinogen-III synthase [Parendozoicomonas sp. Alg238-R29]
MSLALEGLRVLITRPQPQAGRLAAFLQAKGARTTVLPMVAITPLTLTSQPDNLAQFSKIIAISVPSVDIALRTLPEFSPQTQWVTPGLGTAQALKSHGIQPLTPHSEFTSEAMLALPELNQVTGEKILLLKGEGGRELLRNELSRRGAEVVSLDLYRRQCPDYQQGEIETTVASADINAIVATSGQIVSNLHTCCPDDLKNLPLIIPSQRVAEKAEALGFKRVVVSQGAGDQDIAEALLQLVY